MSSDAPPADQKKSFYAKLLRPKVAIPLTLLLLLLLSPFLVRGWHLRGVPNPPEPFDSTPLLKYTVPDNENAFTDYRRAVSLYVKPSRKMGDLRDQINEHGWQLANDDVLQFLHDNEDSLLAWKAGTEKNKALYISAADYHLGVPLKVGEDLRDLDRTVMLLCRKLEAEGKPLEAWEWYRAAIRASRIAGAHGGEIERRIGIALWLITADQLESWAAQPKLTSDDLSLAMRQLQSEWKRTAKASTAIQFEYLGFSRALGDHTENMIPLSRSHPAAASRLLYVFGEPALSRRLNRFYFFNLLAFCDLPRYQRPPTRGIGRLYDDPQGFIIEDVNWSLNGYEQAANRALLIRLASPFRLSALTQAIDREEARHRMLLVTLAGQAFQRDHGRFPDTLNELVPEYLDSIPIDNYDGKPLKYRFDPEGPVVYSVFENQTDEGGVDWSWDIHHSGRTQPYDYGSQMRIAEPRPLTAPKPARH